MGVGVGVTVALGVGLDVCVDNVKPNKQDPAQGAKSQAGGTLFTYEPSGHCFTSFMQTPSPGQGLNSQLLLGSLPTYEPSEHCFTSSVQDVAASGWLDGTLGATDCCLSW